MAKEKGINLFFVLIAFILGGALYKDFDFNTFRFEQPALGFLYLIVFSIAVYFIIKDFRKQPE